MKKIYNSKAFWMIVSLLASLAIWVYVTSVETDESKTTFRGVKVELVGEDILRDSKNLVVTDMDTSTVTVEVVGPRRIIGSLSSAQLVAQVDVSKLSRAAYTSQQYTIVYPDGTDTSKLSENRRTPETINFMVSAQTSKSIQVRGSFDSSLAEGYTAEMPVFEPSTITITGSEAYLKDVEYAWVTFSKENVDSTYSVETGFTLMDANNEPCSTTGISFSTDVVTATLPLLTLKGLLFHYKPRDAVITVDGINCPYKKVWLAPTMNGRYYGGGMMPTPNQNRLGLNRSLSVMVFFGSSKLKTLAIFPSIFKGEHINHRHNIKVLCGHEITVRFDRPTPLQIDGETILGVTEYTVRAADEATCADIEAAE